jgi:UDP-GlcNAc3NAcA epimerase
MIGLSAMKIATVVGARPQFIKAAMVSRALRVTPGVEEICIHTGQHYDRNMSDIFFEELEIPRPDYYLDIGSGPQGAQTGRMLESIEQVLLAINPDCALVYGDTNSTLAGALAATKLHIWLAHVEAGLRSFNRQMPEEINRVLTDHTADLLFAPTRAAIENLRQEGIPKSRIHLVGDVMYDAALYYGPKADQKSQILQKLGLEAEGYILATVHRAENTNNPRCLRTIFEGLGAVAEEVPIVLPLHPRTRAAIEREKLLRTISRDICLIEPLGYLDMVMLEKNARLIATDSGGVQKEAFFYRVPCVTLRGETEWSELVEMGWNHLIPPLSATKIFEGMKGAIGTCGAAGSPYGDGQTGQKIALALVEKYWQ